MTTHIGIQEREAAEQDAIAHLLCLDAPDAAESDWLALEAWLKQSPLNREAFDKVERLSAELTAAAPELLRALDAKPAASAPRRPADRKAPPLVRRWRAVGALAAAAAALVVFVGIQPDAVAPTQVYQTAKGETRTLDLADGSHIHLNSASKVSVRLERKGRFVELAEGEAAFDVAKDAQRPFLIAAGERDIRVVGTEFDVLRHQGRLRVTVRRGVVAVQSPKQAAQAEPVLLRAGDQIERHPGSRTWAITKVDPNAAFAWRNGDLVYRDRPLDEVVEDLNRYFDTPVRVAGPAASLRFSGVLKIDRQDAVLRRLESFLPLNAESSADGVTLQMRGAAG